MMLTGLGIAVIFYVLVAISVIAVIPEGEIEAVVADEGKVLLDGRRDRRARTCRSTRSSRSSTVFAVANTALINMLMASRLLYGLAHQDVLPRALGKVLPGRRTPYAGIAFSTVLALGLIVVVTFLADTSVISALSGTTALLLLCVFSVVNVACLVLRRDPAPRARFQAPGWVPVRRRRRLPLPRRAVGARPRATGSSTRSPAACSLLGIVLWALTWMTNRGVRAKKTGFRDIEHLED